MPQRSHEDTGWLSMLFLFLSDKISLVPKTGYIALRRREHRLATDAFLNTEICVFLCFSHITGMRLAALMQTFTSTTVSGYVLREKGLQRQIDVGALVSSQEQRALAVPLINRR